MRRVKKICIILLSIVCLFAIVMIGYSAENNGNSQKETGASEQDRTLILEDEELKVSYESGTKAFQVTDYSGYMWNSIVTEELCSSDKLNETWQRNAKSIFHITYADISDVDPTIKTAYSYDADIKATKEDSKIYLNCEFASEGIKLVVVLQVDNGELVVSVPAEHISEEKEYKLLGIQMLPYFGASSMQEDGYMVYPDGSGALKYHNSVKSSVTTNHQYSWDVYGSDFLSTDTPQDNEDKELMSAMLPVYGIKKGEHAFIAYSEVGEEESSINLYPAGMGIELNRMSFSFRYRTTYNILMSNININGKDTAKNLNGKMYSEEMIDVNHELRYSFLSGEEADYSGMAGKYRDRLLSNGTLHKSELEENIGVSIDILMAASAQGFFSDTVSVATTAEQVDDIMGFVDEIGFKNHAMYTLKGWSKGGYGVYPQTEKPDGKVASVSEFVKLLDSNHLVSLQVELFYANEDNGGFSRRSDVIKTANQNVITDSESKLFWLNADSVNRKYQSINKTYSAANKLNLSFNTIGEILYRDENKDCAMNRGEVRNVLETTLKQAKERGSVSVEGGNLYALKYADIIYDLPSKSSEYFISDINIPFCQIVLHGVLPYTGDAGNISSDYDKQILKWLEYGYIPSFELTYSDSEVLKETNYNDLYSSQYTSNASRLEEALEVYKGYISKVKGAYIAEHTVLENGLIKIEYSNGCILYINYSQQEQTCDNVTVEAEGCVMVGD